MGGQDKEMGRYLLSALQSLTAGEEGTHLNINMDQIQTDRQVFSKEGQGMKEIEWLGDHR